MLGSSPHRLRGQARQQKRPWMHDSKANCRVPRSAPVVYMSFMHREGWHCEFLEEDLTTSLPRKVTLDTPAKLIEMAKRRGSNLNLETRQALHHGNEIGRGGVWLELTEEQYARLRKR
jgi:hypothetical protein